MPLVRTLIVLVAFGITVTAAEASHRKGMSLTLEQLPEGTRPLPQGASSA